MEVDGRETDRKPPKQKRETRASKDPEPIPFHVIAFAGLMAAVFYVAALIEWPWFTAISTVVSVWLVYFIYHPEPSRPIRHFLSQHEPAILSALLLIMFTLLAPEAAALLGVIVGGCYVLAKLTGSVLV